MDSEEIRSKLGEYLAHLEAGDWDWCIPRQDSVSSIVASLSRRPSVWPMMGGSYWPSEYPRVQKQRIEQGLINLAENPSILDKPEEASRDADPWQQTAVHLSGLADSMPEDAWTGQALEAQQTIRRVDPAAANQIGLIVERYDAIGQEAYPSARSEVISVLRGAATAARLHGPSDAPDTPSTVVNVSQQQSQTQQQAAVSMLSIEDLLASEDLPEELRPVLNDMQKALDAEDRPGFLKRASEFAGSLAKFPDLALKIGDAWEWVSKLSDGLAG